MGELEERSGGAWRPSSGSVYPTLEQLVDEGLVRLEVTDGARAYALTDAGRAYVESRRDELEARCAGIPRRGAGTGMRDMRDTISQLMVALYQVTQVGNEAQIAEARRVMGDARRALYGILAGDHTEEGQ